MVWISRSSSALARFAGDETVYRAASVVIPDPQPDRWLDLKLVDLEIPSVRVVRIERLGAEPVDLILQDDGR